MRAGYIELAEIQNNFGFSTDALNMMRKAYHETTHREDQFSLGKRILLMAFEAK